jgi:chromosome segregation ATPase
VSTHPHSDHDELDRTDELPRLDVAAYEAKLAAEASDTLGSTDTWAIDGLRDAEAEEAKQQQDATAYRFPRTRAQPERAKTSDVTLDANRILGRLSQLESELAAAREQQTELQARFDRLNGDFATKEKEVRALSADNARLTEQRALVADRIKTLEQQLKDDTAQFERDLTQQRDTRSAEQNAATKARLALEQQVAELNSMASQLREDNSRLDDEAKAATKLVKTQTGLIDQFKQRLQSEEKNAAQLARHLAAKIAEYSGAANEIERREATIRLLTTARDDLAFRLDEMRIARDSLQAELQDSAKQIEARNTSIRERDETIVQRDGRIKQLENDLRAAQAASVALEAERDTLQRMLTAERESQSQAQQVLSARAQEIDQLHGSTEELHARITSLQHQLTAALTSSGEQQAKIQDLERTLGESQLRRDMLTSEVESMRARVQQLELEASAGLTAREALTAKSTELERSQTELSTVQRELDEVRAYLVTKHSQLAESDNALRAAQEIVANLRRMNEGLEQNAEDTRRRVALLESRDREREEGVLSNSADLAAARRQLGQQLAAVQSMEQAIRARDTLMERLRTELQTSQDERAIMAGQLEKSRLRNKTMAREIFSRDNQIVTLKGDLAVHAETLAAIRQDVNRASAAVDSAESADRILEPVDHAGDIIALDKKMMTIGRTSDNDICIPSKLVSRNHARLLIGPNAIIVEDAGSTNGCFVNDVLVKQQLMREGDVLSIGDLKYRLRTRADSGTRLRDNVIPFGGDTRHDG